MGIYDLLLPSPLTPLPATENANAISWWEQIGEGWKYQCITQYIAISRGVHCQLEPIDLVNSDNRSTRETVEINIMTETVALVQHFSTLIACRTLLTLEILMEPKYLLC